MKYKFLVLGIAIAAALIASASAGDAPLTIVTVGDSTVADYPKEDIKRGWGQMLGEYLAPSVTIINLAECGRSTKTYFETRYWLKATKLKPDYILIQFGHNDSHPKDQPESTDAATDYQDNLRRYVAEARQAGAKPILVTPMHRLVFTSGGKLSEELKPYADAMKHVAHETNVPVIDLYEQSTQAFEPLGFNGVNGMTASETDRTHFTEKGARILAKIVAEEVGKIDPRLKQEAK